MLFERDSEVEARASRQGRETRSEQDTRMLLASWRAIARSHRLLDREFFGPRDGELVVRRMGRATRADSGQTGDGPHLPKAV
jgi:hypothetical protein